MKKNTDGELLGLIKRDHAELRKLMDACESDVGLFCELRNHLKAHEIRHRHKLSSEFIKELDEIGPYSTMWWPKFSKLKSMLNQQFEKEEIELGRFIELQSFIGNSLKNLMPAPRTN